MDKIIVNIFGGLIKAFREQMRLSVQDFAQRTGVSASTVTRLEKGQDMICRDTVAKIGMFLGYNQIWQFQMAARYYDRSKNILLPETISQPVISFKKKSIWSRFKQFVKSNLFPEASEV